MKIIEDVDVIIVGNDHYNTVNVLRALGRKSLRCGVLIISDDKCSIVLKSRYVSYGNICSECNAISELIEKYGRSEKRIPLIATDDTSASLLDQHLYELSEYFIMPSCGGIQGELHRYMSKNLQLKAAEKANFDIPVTYDVDLRTNVSEIIDDIKFPCIIKPEKSVYGSKQDFRICNSSLELVRAIEELKSHVAKVLIQEYVSNDEVILVSGVRGFNGDTYVYGEINKYKKGTKSHNLGLCCMGVLLPDSEIRNHCIKLVEEIDYHGCFSIEILRKRTRNGKKVRNYFIEINLRTDGLFFFYTKAGLNFPYIWYQCCMSQIPSLIPSKAPIYGINEFLYLREIPSLKMLKDFLKADVFSLFDRHDIKPFIYKFINNVKK